MVGVRFSPDEVAAIERRVSELEVPVAPSAFIRHLILRELGLAPKRPGKGIRPHARVA